MAVSRRTASNPRSRGKKKAPARRATRRAPRTASSSQPSQIDRDDAIALAQLVSRGSRPQFAQVFRDVQKNVAAPLDFEAVSSTTDDVSAYVRAFLRASAGDWLVELCIACIHAGIVEEGFSGVAANATHNDRLAQLQQVVDPERGLYDAKVLAIRVLEACRKVCQIEIDGTPRGTGFLVRPDHVMTAYHVVRPLLQGNAQVAGSGSRLRARFDYVKDVTAENNIIRNDGQRFPAAEQWLVASSPCTPDESVNQLPADEEALNNFWDFAVIRLAESPLDRESLKIATRPVRRGHRLTILQHPRESPVAMGIGTVRRFLGTGGFRVVHRVNTDEGSSGSPCLNDDFDVVCLHQAQMPNLAKRSRTTQDDDDLKENRAVPMVRILTAWSPAGGPAQVAPVRRLFNVDTATVSAHPLFGRFALQAWIERAAADATSANSNRFLAVTGTSGTGKSFTVDIIKAMLRIPEHAIIACKASHWTTETAALGLVEKYFLPPLGATEARLPPLAQANTSDNAWLNYQFIGDLLSVIDKARKGRMVWMVLDDLDRVVLPDQGQIRKLLDLLYSRTEQAPWLRFVLIGLDAVPVPGTAQFTERDVTGTESQADLAVFVTEYLVRRLESGGIPIDRAVVAEGAARVVKLAAGPNDVNISDDPEMLRRLVDAVMVFEKMNRLRSGGR